MHSHSQGLTDFACINTQQRAKFLDLAASLQLIQGISPLLHQGSSLREQLGIIVSPPDGVSLLVRQCQFDCLGPDADIIAVGIAGRG